MAKKYTLEADVDDFVKSQLIALALQKLIDFNEKSAMSEYLKAALRGSSKTTAKSSYGQPDFTIEKYPIPVVVEDKLGNRYHIAETKDGIKMDDTSIKKYAVNGAIYYAKNIIASKKYKEVIAIGISGDNDENIQISVYYVFSSTIPPKKMATYTSLNFLQNEASFNAFYNDATVTEAEKHKILVQSRDDILRKAKKLNKLMNNFNIGVEQRVVYVSGLLLAMQDIVNKSGQILEEGLIPDELKGITIGQNRDSLKIINHIEDFLAQKDIDSDKKTIMIETFKNSISIDSARDLPTEVQKEVGQYLKEKSSINKQIFTYLYHNVFLTIDMSQGALDIMAEMYSTFLKYALSDGASLGKVLTPPYITSLMAKILDIDMSSRVMDLATGSAAFLVAAMDMMIADANQKLGKGTSMAETEIDRIKHQRLLGVEIDAKMYTLAATNMILRGDGSTNIKKADTFTTPETLYKQFNANRFLLNPPFSYRDYGMPFFAFGLDNMEKGGLGAVIIIDSSGAGKSVETNKEILSKHRMVASIKMPADLFIPNAIVSTSIYVFEAKVPHNFELDKVKFIDFSNDGYKRTERCIKDVDHPAERYEDIYLLYKLGFNAVNHPKFHSHLWNIDAVYCEDTISNQGNDWNFSKHSKKDNQPKKSDFLKSIQSYLLSEFSDSIMTTFTDADAAADKPFDWKIFKASDVFEISSATPSYDKGDLITPTEGAKTYNYITRQSSNRGICAITGFISKAGIFPAGTYSLGVQQMIFYYRDREWYAGQFIKIIKCKTEIDQYAALYLETILNGLSKTLLAGLVREIEGVFNNSEITLPIDKDGKIDYDWMSKYMKAKRKKLLDNFIKSIGFNNEEA